MVSVSAHRLRGGPAARSPPGTPILGRKRSALHRQGGRPAPGGRLRGLAGGPYPQKLGAGRPTGRPRGLQLGGSACEAGGELEVLPPLPFPAQVWPHVPPPSPCGLPSWLRRLPASGSERPLRPAGFVPRVGAPPACPTAAAAARPLLARLPFGAPPRPISLAFCRSGGGRRLPVLAPPRRCPGLGSAGGGSNRWDPAAARGRRRQAGRQAGTGGSREEDDEASRKEGGDEPEPPPASRGVGWCHHQHYEHRSGGCCWLSRLAGRLPALRLRPAPSPPGSSSSSLRRQAGRQGAAAALSVRPGQSEARSLARHAEAAACPPAAVGQRREPPRGQRAGPAVPGLVPAHLRRLGQDQDGDPEQVPAHRRGAAGGSRRRRRRRRERQVPVLGALQGLPPGQRHPGVAGREDGSSGGLCAGENGNGQCAPRLFLSVSVPFVVCVS